MTAAHPEVSSVLLARSIQQFNLYLPDEGPHARYKNTIIPGAGGFVPVDTPVEHSGKAASCSPRLACFAKPDPTPVRGNLRECLANHTREDPLLAGGPRRAAQSVFFADVNGSTSEPALFLKRYRQFVSDFLGGPLGRALDRTPAGHLSAHFQRAAGDQADWVCRRDGDRKGHR